MKELDELMLKVNKSNPSRIRHYKVTEELVRFISGMVNKKLDFDKLIFAARYHDIGRVMYLNDFNCFHQYATFLILKEHGFEEEGDIAMRHNGFGWSSEETEKMGFKKEFGVCPDLLPNSIESKILAFADGLRGKNNSRESLWDANNLTDYYKSKILNACDLNTALNRKKRIVEELERLGMNTKKVLEKARKLYEK